MSSSSSSRKLSFKVEKYGSSSSDNNNNNNNIKKKKSDTTIKKEESPLSQPPPPGTKVFTHYQFVDRFRILANKVFPIEESDYLDTTDLCTILVETINKNVLKIDGTIVERTTTTTATEDDTESNAATIGGGDTNNPDEIQLTEKTVIIPQYTLNRLEEQRFQSVSNTAEVARNFLRQQKLQREFGRTSFHEKNEAAIVLQCFWRVIMAKRERERMAKIQWVRLKQELASCKQILQEHSIKLKEKESETFYLQEKVEHLEVINEKLSILAETLTVSRETAVTDDTTFTNDPHDHTNNMSSSLPHNTSTDQTVMSTGSYWRSNSPFAMCWNRRFHRE